MAVHLFNRYVWLLDLISQGGKTYEDIDRAWRNNYRLNHNKEPLPKRTLHNWRMRLNSQCWKICLRLRLNVANKGDISML